MSLIPFNKPYLTGRELDYIRQAHSFGQLSGDGPFTEKCQCWLEKNTGSSKALLTHSCTGALEMAAILSDIKPGDEVIMPSFTFVSTANAFVLRGAVPVFVDIRPDTLNIDETIIEAAITAKTKAIVVVHYAGVACEMNAILAIAQKHVLWVIEDAAQGIGSKYQKRPLGSIGHLGVISFHETKNITCGEGGALLVNDRRFIERSEIIRQKGTDRTKFIKGQINKYTWIDIGSSFLPGELAAAFLWAQFEHFDYIMSQRISLWMKYHLGFQNAEEKGFFRRPLIPSDCQHNGHMYYILLPDSSERASFISGLGQKNISAIFHYVPLHSSPAGRKYGRVHGSLKVTDEMSSRIVRLPFWIGMEELQESIIESVLSEAKKTNDSR